MDRYIPTVCFNAPTLKRLPHMSLALQNTFYCKDGISNYQYSIPFLAVFPLSFSKTNILIELVKPLPSVWLEKLYIYYGSEDDDTGGKLQRKLSVSR